MEVGSKKEQLLSGGMFVSCEHVMVLTSRLI